jgi:C-terminal processing protease CtpA/Prc
VILRIDGMALGSAPAAPGAAPAPLDPWALLDRKAGRPTLLSGTLPGGAAFEEVVKPVPQREERELLYRRWVRRCREAVDRLSRGRAGYVHVKDMDDDSFRQVFMEALGRHGAREALVVDTRWNGGGWLHDDLVKFLGGSTYALFQPRGKVRGALGSEPLHRWAGPVVVLQNEGNYSDAHVFPYAFKRLGLGKLVGTPVAGTGTAVWWETQIDPTLVFGVPQVGLVTPDGDYLENRELVPDVEVYNTPEDSATGRDRQLERAVEEVLKK